MSDGSREQLFLVTFVVAGIDLGTWDKADGIAVDTDSAKYRSGGSADEEDLGGGKTYPDVTVSRNFRLSRDANLEGWLITQCRLDAPCSVYRQPLDRSYNPFGSALLVQGLFKTYTPSNSDSTSNNPAEMAAVVGVNSISVV